MAIGIDAVGKAVRAVVEGLGQLGPHEIAGARQELLKGVSHDLGTESINDFGYPCRAKIDCRH